MVRTSANTSTNAIVNASVSGTNRPHRVIVQRQGMLCALEEKEVHGRQQDVRPALPEGRFAQQSEDVRIVGNPRQMTS